ncbi:MAG TPA: TOBE domain-containing protein, partial [Planctomycetota bacterium]|nr:TOBE domain-containing protein [Planctomycetota bacterium]
APTQNQLADSAGIQQVTEELKHGLRGTVEVVEPIGDRGYVHVRTGRARLVATIEGTRAFGLRAGAEVALTARPEALHRFDPAGARVEDQAIRFAGA